MSIRDLIDASVSCVKCGTKSIGNCHCFDIVDPVTLLCTICKKTKVVEREDWAFDFKVIETTCPDCDKKAVP